MATAAATHAHAGALARYRVETLDGERRPEAAGPRRPAGTGDTRGDTETSQEFRLSGPPRSRIGAGRHPASDRTQRWLSADPSEQAEGENSATTMRPAGGPVHAGGFSAYGAPYGRRYGDSLPLLPSATFLAQHIAQEVMQTGLHLDPHRETASSYTRAAAGTFAGNASPAPLLLDVAA
ncbi:MAG: hypothetical protein RLQ25_08790 [Alphaproteobacteria bacterium]